MDKPKKAEPRFALVASGAGRPVVLKVVAVVGILCADLFLGTPGSPPAQGPDPLGPQALPMITAPLQGEVVLNAPGDLAWGGSDPAAPLWASTPVSLQIPAISVNTPLMPLGLLADGTMEVPPAGFPAGWYTGAPTPGELGPAIIAGHLDWDGPGVFFDLHLLKVGDEISVVREDGSVALFRVNGVGQYPKDLFPTALVYGGIDFAGLRLVTCGGVFDRSTGHYDDNIVVYAELFSSTRVAPAAPPEVVEPVGLVWEPLPPPAASAV